MASGEFARKPPLDSRSSVLQFRTNSPHTVPGNVPALNSSNPYSNLLEFPSFFRFFADAVIPENERRLGPKKPEMLDVGEPLTGRSIRRKNRITLVQS